MRLWSDSSERLMTDEQLLRHIAYFGSLEKACESGDIVLVKQDPEKGIQPNANQRSGCRSLSDYLKA